MIIYDMKTEDLINPIGIDEKKPRFSWKLQSKISGTVQTAYRIIVLSDNDTVWDSGKVTSDRSICIEYDGRSLSAMTKYSWQVSVWDEQGNEYTSDTADFETGLMNNEFNADWIGSPQETVNTYAVDNYKISCTFKSDNLGLVANARNKDNYVLFNICKDSVSVYEISDNAWNDNVPYKKLLGTFHVTEHADSLELSVNKTNVLLYLNGQKVIDEDILPKNIINQPRKTFLMSVGFNQLNSIAEISRLKIETNNLVLQEDNFENGLFSALGTYENGKLTINNAFEIVNPVPSVNLRKRFNIKKAIKSARLYASAQGFYNACINGEKVSDDFYNPGFTDYRLRIQYQTFDVTDMLADGKNVISAVLGRGHYSGFCGYRGAMIYGKESSFIAMLNIVYTDGTSEVIKTDSSWEFTDKAPISDCDYFDGESYDARLEYNPLADDKRWVKCGIKQQPKKPVPTNGTLSDTDFKLTAQKGNTAKIIKNFIGKFVCENPKNHFVYDVGQNMVGTIKLKVKGQCGQSIKIRYGEMTHKDGCIYIKNLRSAANTDIYTLCGRDTEEFIPTFASHGFRYVEISGNGCNISKDMIISVDGLAISNIDIVTGEFECSNPLINRLQHNIRWGEIGNFLLIPTDCPQRNERMGWTGDMQVFAKTGAYNMNIKSFIDKWLDDLIDAQTMYNKNGAVPDTAPLGGDNRIDGCGGWGDAATIVPWEMYETYGDIRILKKCYDMMKKWVEYQSSTDRRNYGVRTVDGKEVPEQSDLATIPYIQVQQCRGDHLTYDNSTPYIYSATAYAAHSADILRRTAYILGKTDDEKRYTELFENIKRAFNDAWVNDDGSVSYYGEVSSQTAHCGESVALDGSVTRYTYYAENTPHCPSQTAYALAVDFDLIPKDKLKNTRKYFKNSILRNNGKLTVGFLGISHLAPALSKVGLDDVAFKLLEQEDNPSWLYSVKNGATTIWERWNSYIAETGTFGDVSMNSFNHYSYGAIGQWFFTDILGICPVEFGYKSFMLSPKFGDGLTYAKGSFTSPYGKISSAWKLHDGKFTYDCTIPTNTTATLKLPNGDIHTLVGGSYHFEINV